MSRNVVSDAAGLLKRHYGLLPEYGGQFKWSTLVRVVLDRGKSAKKSRDCSWIDESTLRTADETAAQTGSQLEECLDVAGHVATQAGVLSRLAKWWLQSIGDMEAGAVFNERSLQAWQQELRAIRGVSWELADRILLFTLGLAVYPLDRGSMRIAARHGWMEVAADYEDWQVFFVGGLRDAEVDFRQFATWNGRVGREFCGAQPKCDECPLKTLLPERGPVPLDGED